VIGHINMLNIMKDICKLRYINRTQLFVFHGAAIVSIFTIFVVFNLDHLYPIVRIYSIIYSCMCVYLLVGQFVKYYFMYWPIIWHSLIYSIIEIQGYQITYYLSLYVISILLALIIAYKFHKGRYWTSII
jgi:hypothetical protein